MSTLVGLLSSRPLVAVLQAPTAERFVEASEVLYEAGIVCVEYTPTIEGALDALLAARRRLPRDARIGRRPPPGAAPGHPRHAGRRRGRGRCGASLRAGAAAIGVSRALVGDALHPGGDLTWLRARADRVVESLAA
jgi:hypothetical protein